MSNEVPTLVCVCVCVCVELASREREERCPDVTEVTEVSILQSDDSPTHTNQLSDTDSRPASPSPSDDTQDRSPGYAPPERWNGRSHSQTLKRTFRSNSPDGSFRLVSAEVCCHGDSSVGHVVMATVFAGEGPGVVFEEEEEEEEEEEDGKD